MQAPTQRYPLTWPNGWIRTPPTARTRAKFSKRRSVDGAGGGSYSVRESLEIGDGLVRMFGELRRLRASDVIVSSNLQLRSDGVPYSKQGKMLSDPGVAVYFKLKGAPRVLACDKWASAAENMAAIAGHIEAIRMQDRYGVGTIEQAFAGYAALPPTSIDWAIVLGVSRTASKDDVAAAHRRLALIHHPDRGGRLEEMARINEARDIAFREIEGRA